MARLGFEHEVDIENTVSNDFGIMPEMIAGMEATAIDLIQTKDNDPEGLQANITFEVLQPDEFKGRKIWAYWTIRHSDPENKGLKYGARMFDSFCRAVHVMKPEDTDELILKAFPAKIGISEGQAKPGGGKYNDKNQISEFFYTDDKATKPVPEIGVIAGGKTPSATPANDNRPAAKPAAAAPAKKNPWAK